MVETRVQRTVEGKVGHCELPYAPQSLERRGVDQRELAGMDLNEPMNRIAEMPSQ
jgi:hypothetical protein